jgi:GT2 family glycosyltransferase
MSSTPVASIVIPTRGRPAYLDVALGSIAPQAAGADLLVVSDGGGAETRAVAERHGARVIEIIGVPGANAARNAGIAASTGDPVVIVDDDVLAPPGWLRAVLDGVRGYPDHDVFGGPIRADLDGHGPRSCGGEKPPITTLDLGDEDRDAEFVWSANMAIRRRALERVGPFDESIHGRGEEEDWERRYRALGGRIRYLAAAGLDHRRTGADATLRRLSVAAYRLGRTARRYDRLKSAAPSIAREGGTLAGTIGHVIRRRCPSGVVSVAHSAGRLVQSLGELVQSLGERRECSGPGVPVRLASTDPDDFLSGTSGQVWGIRATTRALAADLACDTASVLTLAPWRIRSAAARWPRRRVLALAVRRDDVPNVLPAARDELLRSRHYVRFESTPAGDRGKFENLDALLERVPADEFDWLLVVDDDVALPRGFLDAFVFLAERFDLAMAQPAHRWRSHAAWNVTRRRPLSIVRETAFVEIGPVCALRADTFETLLPFPPLRFGWGLDAHWSALARSRGWRQGVIDATPIQHGLRRIASSYDPVDAIDEGRAFLSDRPYTPAAQSNRTLVTHRHWS